MGQHYAKYFYTLLIQLNMKDVQNMNNGKVKEEGGILYVRNTINSGSEA